MVEAKTVYFENSGSENTEEVLRIARRRAEEAGINTVLVASNSGDTAVKATEVFKGMKVVAVSRITGHQEANEQPFTEENRRKMESKGGVVLTATEAFGGVSRAMRNKFNMYLLGDIILNTLRIFGTGTQVACEISLMAADAGLVRTDEPVISIGGSHRGADTAIVLKPVNSTRFFDLRVMEVICKPHFAVAPQAQAAAAAEHHHH
ncbi:MAG: pyruvate kinase alpha/beta domain-containing protein [Dehalococcoidales bacterium]|nr:pyruvate kinase alpha/beta domain-containing protein [Dehalococcoidales bacterium]